MQTLSALSLKGRALRALAGREHSRTELERKLARFETTPGELAQILDELAAKGFINEQRVAETLAYRRGAKLGAARVVQELKAKGVDPEVVALAGAALKATEYARAVDVWRKKFGRADSGAAHSPSPAERSKQMRFLASRGFSAEVIRKTVSGAGECEFQV